MYRIGIDFDNTIACYDQAFLEVAALNNIDISPSLKSKNDIKENILKQENGQHKWQSVQGKVYGKFINLASLFVGVYEFIYLARERGHKVFIVSHKTEFGHFDEEFVPLRVQAIAWLRGQGLLGGTSTLLKLEDVFFEATQADKVARICQLDCTHFIDDLPEVLASPEFPDSMIKILFDPRSLGVNVNYYNGVSSWRGITAKLFNCWGKDDIISVLRRKLPELDIAGSEVVRGRGNSRIFQVTTSASMHYILKCYPDRHVDARPRLITEFSALQALFQLDLPVPKPFFLFSELDWGVYENVQGEHAVPDAEFVRSASDFVKKIYHTGKDTSTFDGFGLASEACLSGEEIIKQIQRRLEKLKDVTLPYLQEFLDKDFKYVFDFAHASAKKLMGDKFSEILDKQQRFPSPSDFGAHNAILTNEGRIVFIDFEYFGWDDPVKLVSDFYWHPAMALCCSLRGEWVRRSEEIFKLDEFFSYRLNAYLPLFGLRWCLILLNEFLVNGISRRNYANPIDCETDEVVLRKQFTKAAGLLAVLKEHVNHGCAF